MATESTARRFEFVHSFLIWGTRRWHGTFQRGMNRFGTIRTVARALRTGHPPAEKRSTPRGSLLDPNKPKAEALLARYPGRFS
ncbi:MAG TPA: hypothetical protein PK992_06240 [Planctomycetaceae bacterium]|nr:hypothetical protein [Planctomycetaceae bacterium]